MSIYNIKMETMEREELSRIQLERLQKIVDYCIKKVPLYKEKLGEVGIISGKQITKIEDINKLPFTLKSDIQENYPKGILAVPMSKVARVHASSGTKGNPTIGYYTKKDIKIWQELTARVLMLNNLTKEDIIQISFGYGLFTGALGFHYGAEKIGSTIVPASTGNTQKQIKMLCDVGVTALMATPSYVTQLSEMIANLSLDESEIKITKVLLGAERCTKNMRELIRTNLKCDVFDTYGLTECFGPGVAGECEIHNGMHICEDVFYPEIIDPETGELLPDGEEGELVLTSLLREAMPLLRYRTGDITSLTHEKCKCGRTSVRMKAPTTRTDDMIVFKGINLFPSQIEYALENIPEISPHYLLRLERQKNKDTATLYVELIKPQNTYDHKDIIKILEAINKRLREIIIVRINVEIVEPNTLERFTGKSRKVEDLRYKG